jgi:cytochrome c biogenesis protein
MTRPLDHIDSPQTREPIESPPLGPRGWLRWAWRQLTSMRTALVLLLALAIAAVPGSLVPQRSADPNGVTQYFDQNPQLAPLLDGLQAFDVYTSAWFSRIYLLLFISLIGCIIPRTLHHARALRAAPPRTPVNLRRMAAHREDTLTAGALTAEETITVASRQLRRMGYRVTRYQQRSRSGRTSVSVSAERGYLPETGNLVFHASLIGILVAVGVGGGFGFTGQRVVVEGQSFVNSLASYDSFNPGRFFNVDTLDRYSLGLDSFTVDYEQRNLDALGQPVDYTAAVTISSTNGDPNRDATIKVNEPLSVGSTDMYLLGNGYAPRVTVRDPGGTVVFSDDVPFLPQDANLTSLGVVKVPDGLTEQLGMVGFFYPTQDQLTSGAYVSVYPDLEYPVLTLNAYTGDLGIDDGAPKSVYAMDTSTLTQLTGGSTWVDSIELRPGQTKPLPGGLGTVSLESVKRFASFEVHSGPAQGYTLLFSVLVLAGLLTSLFVPRRRVWVNATPTGDGAIHIQYAGLARGDDPRLDATIGSIRGAHRAALAEEES